MKIDKNLLRVAKQCNPKIESYRSTPQVNMNDDMVRITIDMPKFEGQLFFSNLFTDTNFEDDE